MAAQPIIKKGIMAGIREMRCGLQNACNSIWEPAGFCLNSAFCNLQSAILGGGPEKE
jgi:hypothetical protein